MDVLVLGCGYRYADVELFTPLTKRTVGIDIFGAFRKDRLHATYKDIRRQEPFISSLLKTLLSAYETRGYRNYLRKLSETRAQKIELYSYDGIHIPFPSETFDLVISSSVLEHVMNLPAVIQEIGRVTKRDGISYHTWHNYYSYSGGHAPPAICRKHPWGHLRGKYKMPFLNEVNPKTIESLFRQSFEKVNWRFDQPEQVELLSDYFPSDLSKYDIGLLSHKSGIIDASYPKP